MFKLTTFYKNKNLLRCRRQLSALVEQKGEVKGEEAVEYPPILDDRYKMIRGRMLKEWHDKIRKITTIEEKNIELNMPKYYGWKCLILDDKIYPYNCLPFFQYATNTEFVNTASHVPTNEAESKKVDNFLSLIRSDIQDALEFELDAYK